VISYCYNCDTINSPDSVLYKSIAIGVLLRDIVFPAAILGLSGINMATNKAIITNIVPNAKGGPGITL